MGVVEFEAAGKKALEQFPIVKRAVKRGYQLVSVATSKEKITFDGNITRMTPEDEYEYFYGYYDKSPWDADDRYMICLRVKKTYQSVAPKEPGTVCIIDTWNNNEVIPVGTTHAWNVQQGCMAQWMGPDFRNRIIYNDFRDGAYCSIIADIRNIQEEQVLPLPVYDVSRDGTYALSLDFNRLHRMRPGYGYSNLPDKTRGKLCPDEGCIWKMDIPSGKTEELFRYTDFASFEPDITMDNAEHKVNHLMISPNGKRFMVLHRWFDRGRKHTRLITVNIDKSDMYNLSDDVFVSHCYWKDDNHILAFLRKKDNGDHYYLMKDKTSEYRLLWPSLATDGHCSYSPDKNMIVTDTYPNRTRIASVYVCSEHGGPYGVQKRIARVFSPFKYDNDCRCDLHPRWNRHGDKICIDSVHEGKRALYVIGNVKDPYVPNVLKRIEPGNGKYKIIYFVTRLRKSGPINQTLDLIRHLDRDIYKPIVVGLYKERAEDSIINEFYHAGAEYYCANMGRIRSIVDAQSTTNRLFESIHPDLIHSVGMPLYKIAIHYKNAKHFTTIHNYVFDDYPVKYGKFIGSIMAYQDLRLIKQNAASMVTCSKSLSEIYNDKNGIRINFIRNGVDVDKFASSGDETKNQIRNKLGLPQDKIIAVYTGQVTPRKNQRFAAEAIAGIDRNDVVLVLLGKGQDYDMLSKQYKACQRIIMRGQVENVSEYLQASDLYLSTSHSEGLPIGALEAMAAGLPLMLSNIPQHEEIIEVAPDIGMCFENDDIRSFSNTLNELLTKDLKEWGTHSYQTASTVLSARNMAQEYEKVYSRIIAKKA